MTITEAHQIADRLAQHNEAVLGPRFEGFLSATKGRLGVAVIQPLGSSRILHISFWPDVGYNGSEGGLFFLD